MSLFEQASSRPGSRFGKLSSNMFFTRNTAKPKRVRHIEGLNGALICNVNDDPSVIPSTRSSSLNFHRTNLPAFEIPRRAERLVPPMGFWNTHGVIHDTEHWKQELADLATDTTADQQHASRSGAHYSTRTGRFNEGTALSRGRTGSKHGTAYSDVLFHVPENEREMWMLQVLCQLLGTSHLEDVQSWLVSASPAEKEQASTMINSALRGLKESERTSSETQQSVDLNSLSNFVDKQKNEEKHASKKYIQDTLNRSVPILPSIDEEQQTDIGLNDTWDGGEYNNDYSKLSPQNATTYKRAYQNYNQRSYTSFDGTSSNKKNESYHENEQNQLQDENEELIDTIQLDDDRRRPRSASLTKTKIQSKKPQSPIEQPPSSHKQRHRVESIQFNDNDDNHHLKNINESKIKFHNEEHDDDDEHQQQKEIFSSSHKIKSSANQDDQSKSRKIRELQNKLSRQEEEAKKKFNELQSKQSRLENAIKLLVKQTSSYKKRRQQTHDHVEDLDAPVVNVIIQSPREADLHDKSNETKSFGKHQELPSVHANEKIKKNRNGNNNTKIGDYTIQDVKVQISLSRLDNHQPAKVYSGVWKPDISTLHRLQGN
ncbi:unnamed protein product [Rotaria sp. Silwood2]|nr:unnamed protein product [Rotaria sp. Silwood2]